MAKSGRGQTRATPNEEFFVREKVLEQMENININIISMASHILSIVGS